MTIVHWFKPIDPWMKERISEAIVGEAKMTAEEFLIAVVCSMLLNNPGKLKYSEQLSMASIEYTVHKYISNNDLLKRTAQNSSSIIFDLSEPETGYTTNACEFMIRTCIEAKRLSEEYKEERPIYIGTLYGFLAQKLGV